MPREERCDKVRGRQCLALEGQRVARILGQGSLGGARYRIDQGQGKRSRLSVGGFSQVLGLGHQGCRHLGFQRQGLRRILRVWRQGFREEDLRVRLVQGPRVRLGKLGHLWLVSTRDQGLILVLDGMGEKVDQFLVHGQMESKGKGLMVLSPKSRASYEDPYTIIQQALGGQIRHEGRHATQPKQEFKCWKIHKSRMAL